MKERWLWYRPDLDPKSWQTLVGILAFRADGRLEFWRMPGCDKVPEIAMECVEDRIAAAKGRIRSTDDLDQFLGEFGHNFEWGEEVTTRG